MLLSNELFLFLRYPNYKRLLQQINGKMNFKCFVCSKQMNDLKLIIDHLRKVHFIKERAQPITCIVNTKEHCPRKFYTFNGLRRHILTFAHDKVFFFDKYMR